MVTEIVKLRRKLNDSEFGRYINDRSIGVLVEAISLRFFGEREIMQNGLYSTSSYCYGQTIGEPQIMRYLGIRESLRTFK